MRPKSIIIGAVTAAFLAAGTGQPHINPLPYQ